MSKLTKLLKENINFGNRITLYIPKKIIDSNQIKALKEFHGQRDAAASIRSAVEFFVHREINNELDLFKQISYSSSLENILEHMNEMEKSYSNYTLRNDFYKVSVLSWHFIFCFLNTSQQINYNYNEVNDLIEQIMMYNYKTFINLFPEKGDKFA